MSKQKKRSERARDIATLQLDAASIPKHFSALAALLAEFFEEIEEDEEWAKKMLEDGA